MSSKVSRPRKQRQKDELKQQEIVVQVHRPTTNSVDNVSDKENINRVDNTTTEGSSESNNKTYKIEDRNDNYSMHTPSRDMSVDEESQINSKIISLIETEMKRDINKHSHFTDSRPQSLSFYEDEKIPEELSGNLELLSPEERKHYKRRKEHGLATSMDTEERNAYNAIQDLYGRDGDDIIGKKLSKSRKKRHGAGGGDSEHGMGDSREMMIPKEKRKSKKKKRDGSPAPANNGKRKHRKRDEDLQHETSTAATKNEIVAALDELQDDVFENNVDDYARTADKANMKKSPRKSDKLYVQKKNKFETTTNNRQNKMVARNNSNDFNKADDIAKRFEDYKPIEMASCVQGLWLPFTTLCHGLLGGMSLVHFVYLRTNYWSTDNAYITTYATYSDYYTCLFYFFCVVCIISVFDRYDLSHLDLSHLRDILNERKSAVAILLYLICLLLHLSAAPLEDKISLLAYNNNSMVISMTRGEVQYWNNLSFFRSLLAFLAWIIIGLAPVQDLFYIHLKNMEKYIIPSER